MTDAQKKPGMPPVVKVLLILGIAFVLLVMLGIGTCAVVVMSNPELRKAGSLIGETMRMGIAATKAPGTAELRDAGCDEAMVMDMRRIAALIEEMETEGGQRNGDADAPPPELNMPLVMCQMNSADTDLDCPTLAKIYGAAVEDPPEQFILTMQGRFKQEPLCQGIYSPDGSLVAEMDEEQMRNLSGGGHAVPLFEVGNAPDADVDLEALEGALEQALEEAGEDEAEDEAQDEAPGDGASGGW